MNRIERIVNVERDPLRDLPEGLTIKIDHGAAHAQQGASVGQVLQTGDGGLRTQFAIGWRQVQRHLEHGIASQGTGVVAVFVARRDHQQSKTDDVGEAVCDLIRRTRVLNAGGQAIHTRRARANCRTRPCRLRRDATRCETSCSTFDRLSSVTREAAAHAPAPRDSAFLEKRVLHKGAIAVRIANFSFGDSRHLFDNSGN